MYKNIKNYLLLVILFSLLLLLGCEKSVPFNQGDIIATIGPQKIDWKHLQRSYELTPKWGKGLTYKAAYRNQLDFLIDEKLFAQAARNEGLQKDPKIAGYLDYILKKEMIKELYHQKVATHIQISDKEYKTAYLKMKKKVKFNYIYSPSPEHAQEYSEKLKIASFDDIRLINIKQEYKGTSPEFTFGDMQEELEAVIFEMGKGEVKGPIEISDGFMVVQLIEGSIEKFSSERDFAEKKSKIKKVIFERKARKAANIYIKELMADKNLTLNPPIFYALSEQLSKIIQDKVSETPIPIYLNDREINLTRKSVSTIIDEVLISYRDGEMTVRDFLNEMIHMPADLRPNVKMAEQLKNAIGIVIRNEYLSQQAMELGLESHPNVLYETTIQTDEILSKLWLREFHNRQLKPDNMNKITKQDQDRQLMTQQGMIEKKQEESDELVSHLKFQEFRMNVSDSLKNKYPVFIDTTLLYSRIIRPEDTIRYDPAKMVIRELFN